MIRVPAFCGEFGLAVCYHVPAVYALTESYECEVEFGMEALYPGAVRHIVVPRASDDQRAGGHHWKGQPVSASSPKRRFVPQPHIRAGISADVVVCPRKRRYGASKNWPGWHDLTLALQAEGLDVVAAGAPDSSFDVPCPRTWNLPRFLDASIEAMLSARVVVATDAGLAHLAVLCGRPLVLIGYNGGRVAPGPVVDSRGRIERADYWPIRMDEYYLQPNHMNAPIRMLPNGWERPDDVLRAALDMAEERKNAA